MNNRVEPLDLDATRPEWLQEASKQIADSLDIRETKKIPIMEIFGPTIQGEGMLIGNPTLFIRTGLCDYKCTRCDSLHSVNPELVRKNAMWVTMPELIAMFANTTQDILTPIVTLSGGNPCIHDLTHLFDANDRGMFGGAPRAFALETQGTVWQDWITRCIYVTISPKGPGMGEKFEPDKFGHFIEKMPFIQGNWCIKVAVFDQRDLELIVEINQFWPSTRGRTYISVGNVDPPAPAKRDHPDKALTLHEFRDEVLRNYERVFNQIMHDPRLLGIPIVPQLHTLIWGNEACR